jgi:ribosomal protein S18 acetylase RimI-like enzyme
MPVISPRNLEETLLVPYDIRHKDAVESLWNIPGAYTWQHDCLLKLFGKKLCTLMTDRSGNLIGFMAFYFKNDEIWHRYLHAAIAAVDPKYKGKGYGSILYFNSFDLMRSATFLRGFTANIDSDNAAPQAICKKYGFRVVKSFYDVKLGVRRDFAICDFGKK